MYASSLPSASIQNDYLRLDYLTTTGPRIVGLFAHGMEDNLLAETPDVHWSTPHGEYYLCGGHRLWSAPEDPFYTCPETGLDVIEANDKVVLRSPVDVSGLQKEIIIRLQDNYVRLSHGITWHGDKEIRIAPWAITELQLGGLAILPLSKSKGLQPNRNLVFWPYSDIKDERLEVNDDSVIVHAYGTGRAFKIGIYDSNGWSAYRFGDAILLKSFAVDEVEAFPDMGCNVQVYVNDDCIELETLGAMKLLRKGEGMELEETWQVFVGDHSAIWERARDFVSNYS